MAPHLRILSNVIERFAKLNAAVTGHLYGVMCEGELTVLTFGVNPVDDDTSEIQYIDLQLSMPAEVDLFGILYVDQYKQSIPGAFKDIDVTDNPLLLKYSLDSAEIKAFFYIHQKLEAVDYTVVTEKDILQKFAYVRIEASLPLITEKDKFLHTLQDTRKNLASGKVAFRFTESDTYLLGNDNPVIAKSVKDLLSSESTGNIKNAIKNAPQVESVIPVEMIIKMSNDRSVEDQTKYAPVLLHIKRQLEYCELELSIDALSLVSRNITMTQLYEVLVESVCRNLRLIDKSFASQLERADPELQLPEPMHFKPLNFGHLLTVVYPGGNTGNCTLKFRRSLQRRLALDLNRPYFRKGNAIRFQSDIKSDEPLFNPHEAGNLLVVNSDTTKLNVVSGIYQYYHYMQQGFNDDGWGCAYRSLQTIVSWYRLQGYTDVSIPTHREIRKCLVDIGDKPSNFIDSKQWIGSTEVGFVLETLLGISIKVLCASKGEEMSSLIYDLEDHFQTQGTPVMIGGGVLAHTILGVSCDTNTDEIKFLILDPHYTGSENINTILSKGWCGWKKKDFWRKDAFYNMCLPQRPIGIC